MDSSSLVDVFQILIDKGRNCKPYSNNSKGQAQKHVTTWEEDFNLNAWSGWNCRLEVQKNEMTNNKKTQEVFIYGIFEKQGSARSTNNSIVAVAVTFTRNMPVETSSFKEAPFPFKNFRGAPWSVSNLRYCLSPTELKPINIDVQKKRT
ncbi:MAG: hypothetical protein KBC41_01135 [Candidatus Pacebacteria bacterium]|nr:hypothetical protein [Candidatus Paceibacterota bacterium]MBP9866666.1 hypothetical protein [Candidatus Paceibacterota bacterium]